MARADGGLRQTFRKYLPFIHWQSIEVPSIAKGVPDCNGCYDGVDFWCENKKTAGYIIGLRPEQVAWLDRRGRCGGTVYIAVRRMAKKGPRRGPGTDELWLLDGRASREINKLKSLAAVKMARPELVLGVWGGGPSHWLWNEVASALKRTRTFPASGTLSRKPGYRSA